jgi:hypothetical protein
MIYKCFHRASGQHIQCRLNPVYVFCRRRIINIGIYRHGFFDIVPIAQNIIVEGLHTGLIVLDNNLNVLHLQYRSPYSAGTA